MLRTTKPKFSLFSVEDIKDWEDTNKCKKKKLTFTLTTNTPKIDKKSTKNRPKINLKRAFGPHGCPEGPIRARGSVQNHLF